MALTSRPQLPPLDVSDVLINDDNYHCHTLVTNQKRNCEVQVVSATLALLVAAQALLPNRQLPIMTVLLMLLIEVLFIHTQTD